MSDGQIARHLRTVELYDDVIGLVDRALSKRGYNPDDFRRALDRVLSQGKIEGRQTALAGGIWDTGDRLIEDWQRIVDGGIC